MAAPTTNIRIALQHQFPIELDVSLSLNPCSRHSEQCFNRDRLCSLAFSSSFVPQIGHRHQRKSELETGNWKLETGNWKLTSRLGTKTKSPEVVLNSFVSASSSR
jgi:hypothetical protein